MITNPSINESVIRRMTRLATQHGAINLSQGFPNEPPPAKVRLALAQAVLSGRVHSDDEGARLRHATEQDLRDDLLDLLTTESSAASAAVTATAATTTTTTTDELNQYSPPMGREDARIAVSNYYQHLYQYDVSPDDITLTLGATEAVATALRTIGSPGDKVVIFEPFHELYPSQCGIFYLDPVYVTLHAHASSSSSVEEEESGKWNYDYEELREAIEDEKTKALILNTPHNPTGKVFTHEELEEIVELCVRNDVYIITDEIYEHMTYPDENENNNNENENNNNSYREHILIPKTFPRAASLTLVCNSIGKSASATGWRLGWCLTPPQLSHTYRSIHDQMVAMAPHPMQYASMAYLSLPTEYFTHELHERYYKRVLLLAEALRAVGFEVLLPEGAYYLFVNYANVKELRGFVEPMDAALYLMKEVGVACVPGDNFYGKRKEEGRKYLRFAACRSVEDVTGAIEKLNSKLSAAS